jgi:hypothetical protein
MTDEQSPYPAQDDVEPKGDSRRVYDTRRNRSLLYSIAAIVIIILLALILLRSCGSIFSTVNRRSSPNEIVPVAGARPVDGKVSVWLSPGTDLQTALVSAKVRASDTVDMGGGRYVLTVTTGGEVDAVRALRDVEGVEDAGRVYSQDATPQP